MADNDATSVPEAFRALIDDAAIFPPGNAPLEQAVPAHISRRHRPGADLVGSMVVGDQRLNDLKPLLSEEVALSVVLSAGAGGIAPAAAIAARLDAVRLTGLELALRDHDDLAANARRVIAGLDQARSLGLIDDDVAIYVELPPGEPGYGWLNAADELAAAELRLKFRTGGQDGDLVPNSAELASWITAALDRETPFKCTAGLHRAARHTDPGGWEEHGFLNVLLATRASLDGADQTAVQGVLDEHDGHRLAEQALNGVGLEALARTRRWFTSFGSCDVDQPRADLIALGLL